MYQRVDAADLQALFIPMSRRKSGKGVYFVRIAKDSDAVREAVWRFHEAAVQKGTIIEGAIGNPDGQQLAFLTEIMGTAFETTEEFVQNALSKWMPRMSQENRAHFASSLIQIFQDLRLKGKPQSTLKTIYCKLMCWLYYRFERLMPALGDDDPPRILYEDGGSFTRDELIMLRMLSAMGADVLLLQPKGDGPYLKHDPDASCSQVLKVEGKDFPADFTLKQFRKEMNSRRQPVAVPQMRNTGAPRHMVPAPSGVGAPSRPRQAVPGQQYLAIDLEARFPKPARSGCINAWMSEAAYTEILTPVVNRGDDPKLFYHALIRQNGAQDRLTYTNELYQFYLKLKGTGRKIVVVDEALPKPSPEETQRIRRRSLYHSTEELILDLAGNLPVSANTQLQKLTQYSFMQTVKKASERETNLNRLMTSAVYLLCWIQRYQPQLFQGYRGNEVPVFILMGGCDQKNDPMLIDYFSGLPVDVLILAPDLNRPCAYASPELLELKGPESLPVMPFPQAGHGVQMQTVASHAEGDLDTLLYNDSGLYRSRQFAKSESIVLRTTYDELFILWDQELKYRSSFSTANGVVNMPVLFASVLGVESGKQEYYWPKIKQLLGKDTYLMDHVPFNPAGSCSTFQSVAVKALRDGRLNREQIRSQRNYPFALLREELQEHIFDKLQLMLDRRLIKDTFVNGTEYTVISVVLSLQKELVRMLQRFDFTKKNPKVVCISTAEQSPSLEDAIVLTFLNLVGFDVVIFVPTGYQTIERYLSESLMVEHQTGEYMYDLHVPNFDLVQQPKRSLLDFFRRY